MKLLLFCLTYLLVVSGKDVGEGKRKSLSSLERKRNEIESHFKAKIHQLTKDMHANERKNLVIQSCNKDKECYEEDHFCQKYRVVGIRTWVKWCVPKLPYFSKCEFNHDCRSGVCKFDICLPRFPKRCNADSGCTEGRGIGNCTTNNFPVDLDGPTANFCDPNYQFGANCDLGEDCDSGVCTRGTCTPKNVIYCSADDEKELCDTKCVVSENEGMSFCI